MTGYGGNLGEFKESEDTATALREDSETTFTVNPVLSVVSQRCTQIQEFRIQEEVSEIPFNLIRLLIFIMSFFFLLSTVFCLD